MRGVMEKCTYCLQRIEQAKIAQKTKAGPSGNVVVPEGTFTTACAQACPAGAIVFGNLNDRRSRVSQAQGEWTATTPVLESLVTKPRTTYLARVRNPNPAMPDYYQAPLSLQEYEQKIGQSLRAPGRRGKRGRRPLMAAEVRMPSKSAGRGPRRPGDGAGAAGGIAAPAAGG